MSDAALGILKGCLIALVYLFLLRVVFLVASELRGTPGLGRPAPAPAVPSRRAAKPPKARRRERPTDPVKGWRLVMHEPGGGPERTFPVAGEVTIGRGGGCGIALPGDTYVSTVHARAYRVDGDLWVEDLGSTNGTLVNDEPLTEPVRLRRGDRIKIGSTVLEATK